MLLSEQCSEVYRRFELQHSQFLFSHWPQTFIETVNTQVHLSIRNRNTDTTLVPLNLDTTQPIQTEQSQDQTEADTWRPLYCSSEHIMYQKWHDDDGKTINYTTYNVNLSCEDCWKLR